MIECYYCRHLTDLFNLQDAPKFLATTPSLEKLGKELLNHMRRHLMLTHIKQIKRSPKTKPLHRLQRLLRITHRDVRVVRVVCERNGRGDGVVVRRDVLLPECARVAAKKAHDGV